jgi:HAD superfamily phosphatase
MRLVVFDMDGVLVDPTESFRRAVIETVRHFTGRETTFARIAEIKNEGGYNDDTDIALRLVVELGGGATREEIEEVGHRLFWGEDRNGMILAERWLVNEGVLERLRERARLAIFTGRGPNTARHTLSRFCPSVDFDPIVTSDLPLKLKPAPDGLIHILAAHPDAEAVYVGDTIDDARAAKAAGVPFVGVAAPDAHFRDATIALFQAEGARAVIHSINELETALETIHHA